ncbi:unnamed protein product, partial [Prorocentrum cordatum]
MWQGGRVEKAEALLDYLLNAMHSPLGAVAPSPDSEVATVDPGEAPFAKSECHFDPLGFLGPFVAAAFLEPRPARQAGKPGDLLQHLKQWGDVGRLELVAAAESPPALRGTLFPVFKDSNTQRVVFNRIARNAAELPLCGFSKLTPSAAVLVDLEVPACHVLRAWTDDLQALRGFAALDRLWSRCRREARELPEKSGGCSTAATPPMGAAWGGVVLGDHFGLAVDAPGSRAARRAIEQSFARAREAHADAGLKVSASKEVKGAAEATVIGAELLGHDQLVGASRTRRLALAWVGLSLARGQRSTALGLQRFLGMGLSAALFRRPTLSLLHHCYKEVDAGCDPREVIELSGAACNESALFAVLLPLMTAALSAGWGPRVLASDASRMAGASVKTPAQAPVACAFWRQREQRGARTWLYPHGWAALANPADGGLLRDLEEEAAPPPGVVVDPTASLIEYFDVLEPCLVNSRLAEWIIWLIWQRRVKMTISQVPCIGFSIARHPWLRSRSRPWGFDPSCSPARLGDVLFRLGMLALLAHLLSGCGPGLHGHPLTAYSRHASIVQFLLSHDAVERIGSARPGRRAPASSLREAEGGAPPGAIEALRLNDYVSFAPQLHRRRRFSKPLYINLLEVDAACDAVDEQGLRFPDCKRNFVLDSGVSIGAISKGRSASTASNKLLRRRAPLQLAAGTYVGCRISPTRLQPAATPRRARS